MLLVLLYACHGTDTPKYLIGFSQCIGSDNWRRQMFDEMQQELEFHPEISLIYCDADGNNETQIKQIEELINSNIDLLIVSPNESGPLTAVVDKAYQKGIPVILIDRKTNSQNYTTCLGADNYEIGITAGKKAAMLLNGHGHILEITGLKGSSPAVERHLGFADAISQYSNMVIVKEISGKWLMNEAYDELKKSITANDSIELVFAHNDVMALAASVFFDSIHASDIKIIGVDGLAGKGNGIEMVSKGILSATVLYPTGGEEAISVALRILQGEKLPRRIVLNSTVIDEKNSHIMQQQANKMQSQRQTINRMHERIIDQLRIYSNQRTVLFILIGGLIILALLLIKVFKSYRVINSQKTIITEQNHHLETLNNTKDKFFSIVAHDLKSPLFSLHTMSGVIINDFEALEKTQIITLLKDLHLSLENTLKMTDNLITWARMQMNDLQYKAEEIKVKKIVSNIFEVYKDLASKKEIALNSKIEPSLYLMGDTNQVEFIIRNLVNNAIKYTHSGGTVDLTAKTLTDGDIEIAVSDNGVGISEKIKNSLFLLGSNKSNKGTAGEKGTGLGLMLSYEFARQNNAQISLESTVNEGTTFYVRFKASEKKA